MKKLLALVAALSLAWAPAWSAPTSPSSIEIDRATMAAGQPGNTCIRVNSTTCVPIGTVAPNGAFTPSLPPNSVPGTALNPATQSQLGGVYRGSAPTHQYQTGTDATGAPTFAQPDASDLGSGTIPSARSFALGGDVACPAGNPVACALISYNGASLESQLLPHRVNNAALSGYTVYSQPVLRDGFAAAGDGGRAFYNHSTAACAISGGNKGSQVPAADGGCWNVDWASVDFRASTALFGAQCNGVADDTAAFNAAYATGRPVYAPELGGHCVISSDLYPKLHDQRFSGDGRGRTNIFVTAGATNNFTNGVFDAVFPDISPDPNIGADLQDDYGPTFRDFAVYFVQPQPTITSVAAAVTSSLTFNVASVQGIAPGQFITYTGAATGQIVSPSTTVKSISGTTITTSAAVTLSAGVSLNFVTLNPTVPAFFVKAERAHFEHVGVAGGSSCYDGRGQNIATPQQASEGGTHFDDFECQAWKVGAYLDYGTDIIRMNGFHWWPINVPGYIFQEMYDYTSNGPVAIDVGRVDGLMIDAALFYGGRAINSHVDMYGQGNSSVIYINRTDFDTTAGIYCAAGNYQITNSGIYNGGNNNGNTAANYGILQVGNGSAAYGSLCTFNGAGNTFLTGSPTTASDGVHAAGVQQPLVTLLAGDFSMAASRWIVYGDAPFFDQKGGWSSLSGGTVIHSDAPASAVTYSANLFTIEGGRAAISTMMAHDVAANVTQNGKFFNVTSDNSNKIFGNGTPGYTSTFPTAQSATPNANGSLYLGNQ